MQTLHPVAAHFAVVLPLVALVLQIVALLTKSIILSRASTVTIVIATLMVGLTYFTGSYDGKNVVGEIFSLYSKEAMTTLKAHAEFGLVVLIIMVTVSLLKIVNCKINNAIFNYLVLAGMIVASLSMFVQGKQGGMIVYQQGTIFQSYEIKDSLKTALEEANDTEDSEEKLSIYSEALKDILKINN